MALQDYVEEKPTIRTERLTIRQMCVSDVPALKEWMADKDIYTYWGKGPGRTDKQPELLFEKPEKPSKSFHLGIELNETQKIIGELWVYLIENDRMAKIAVRFGKAYHGNGYATETATPRKRSTRWFASASSTRNCGASGRMWTFETRLPARFRKSAALRKRAPFVRARWFPPGAIIICTES